MYVPSQSLWDPKRTTPNYPMNWLRACPLVLIVAAIYVLLIAVRDDAKLRIAVEGAQIQFEPASVRLRIRVEPDPANRALAVGVVGPDFETSSLEQLEGDRAPITRWRTFTNVPAGEYEVIGELYRPPAPSVLVRARLTVLARY